MRQRSNSGNSKSSKPRDEKVQRWRIKIGTQRVDPLSDSCINLVRTVGTVASPSSSQLARRRASDRQSAATAGASAHFAALPRFLARFLIRPSSREELHAARKVA